MKIQLITDRDLDKEQFPNITISEFGEPRSLDEFDVDIIDLGSENLWRTSGQHKNTIDRIKDCSSIYTMVKRHDLAYIVYVLPQDVTFFSHDISRGAYKARTRLKDMLDDAEHILKSTYPNPANYPNILYEKTSTIIGNKVYNADFYFEQPNHSVSISEMSNKTTTVNRDKRLYLTTLDIIASEEQLIEYIENILPKAEKTAVPEWIETVELFDDKKQKQNIMINKQAIEQAQAAIKESEKRLKENMYYKSILYTNGAELVEVVFSILEQMLSYDLSKFIDEKKEDFLIKKDSYTLIGEIKGVTSNVKSEFVSQVDVHYQGYIDKLRENGLIENVHQVLIMNPFRNKPLQEREPVHDIQIKLAERNGCLIIETSTLLRLYEKFVLGEIDVPSCEKLFTEETGLLVESDFEKEKME